MSVKTQGNGAGFYIVSEDDKNGHRSREKITIAEGQVLKAGAVLAKQSDGKYVGYDNDETSETTNAAGILYDDVDATDGDVEAVAHVRDCVVNKDELVWADTEDTGDRDAAIAQLLALGIVCRP